MTDKEIIKELEYQVKYGAGNPKALDLINRLKEDWLDYCNGLKSEAIKEFAERVKGLTEQTAFLDCWSEGGFLDSIDNLVKEMVGEQE